MGYDAVNHLPQATSKKKLIDFVKLLGFEGKGKYYHFFRDDEYKYLYGVSLTIEKSDNELLVYTRNPIYCSNHDLIYQNYVIKQLKQYYH